MAFIVEFASGVPVQTGAATAGFAIPVAVAIAVLRYRLYDIDRLIRRTLVYGLLTGILGLVYAAVVLLFGQLSAGWLETRRAGRWQGHLGRGALFQPACHRIKLAVDRRFNRRRFDAAQTVEAFTDRLRHEVDLNTLSVELLAGGQPYNPATTASLWLRPSSQSSASGRARAPPASDRA